MPLSQATGARPTKAAACRPVSCPNSGRSATTVQQVLGPTPGAVRSWLARSHPPGPFAQRLLHVLFEYRDLLAQRSDDPLHAGQGQLAFELPLAGTPLGPHADETIAMAQ